MLQRYFLILTLFFTFLSEAAVAQCPTSANTVFVTTDEVCFGARDGTIDITFNDGASPYTIALLFDVVTTNFYLPGFDFTVTQNSPNNFTLTNVPPGVFLVRVNCSGGGFVNVGDPNVDGATHVHAAPDALPPTAQAATNIGCNDFTANWDLSTDATGYRLDVATDAAFTSILAGYNDLDVGNVLTYNIAGLTEGTDYYYRVRAYRNACPPSANSNDIQTTTAPLPVVQDFTSPGPDQACEGEDYFVAMNGSESGVTYEIYVDGNPSGITTPGDGNALNVGPINTLAPGATYALTVYATTGVGCSQFMNGTINLTVNPTPATPIASNDGPKCEGETLTLSTPAVAGATYLWAGPSAFSSTDREPVLLNVTTSQAGTYSVQVILLGCPSLPGTTDVVINPTPNLVITDPAAECTPATVDLTAPSITAGSDAGTLSYWTDAAATVPLASPNAVAISGTYYIQLQSAAGCTNVQPVNVTINPIPNLVITDPAAECAPGTVDLTAPAVTAGSDAGTLSYWTDATATNPLANPNAIAISGTYYIQLQSAAGCANVQPVNVTINPQPNLVITDPAAVCVPGTVDLTAPAVTAGSDAGTLSYWTDVAATIPLANPNTVAASGTYYIQLTNAQGCTRIEPVNVTIDPVPNLVITDPVAECAPGTVDITAPAVTAGSDAGALSYWADAAATNPLANPNAIATSGTYYIQLQSAAGCTNVQPVNVTINLQPNLVITDPTAVCVPGTVDLTAPAITAGSDPGALTYWTDVAATNPLANPNAVATSGTYYIQLQSAAGCTNVQAVNVTIDPIPNLIITDPAAECAPGTIDLTAPAVTAGSDAGTLSYWTDVAATIPLANPNAVAISGTYYIQLQSAAGCTSVQTVNVTIDPQPNLIITDPAAECAPGTVDLTAPAVTAGSDAGTLSYWTDVAATIPLANPNAVAISGTYYIQLQSAAGCANVQPVNVTINPQPNLIITDPAAECAPGTVDITAPAVTAGSDAGALSYWTDAAATNPLANPNAVATGGTYYIQLQSAPGCTNVQAVDVTIDPIPNLVITDPAPECAPGTVDLTAPAVTAGSDAGTLSYWTDVAATIPLANPGTVAVGGTYYIQLQSAAGCTNVQSVQVTILPVIPAPVASNDGPKCEGEDIQLSTPVVAGASYLWAGPNGFTSNIREPVLSNINLTDAGNYQVVIMLGSCTSVPGVTAVAVLPPPSAILSGSETICPGAPADIVVNLSGTGPWNVVYTDGTNTFTKNNIASSPDTIIVTPLVTSTYTLVSVDDVNCTSTDVSGTALITVTPQQNVTLTVGADNTLPGGQATIPVSVSGFNNLAQMQYTIKWNPVEMTFVSFQDLAMGNASIGLAQAVNGEMTFNWTASGGNDTTITDNTILFTITYAVGGAGCMDYTAIVDDSPGALLPLLIADSFACVANVNVVGGGVHTGPTPPAPVEDPVNVCVGAPSPAVSVTPDASPGTVVYWYSDKDTLNQIGTGVTLNPVIDTSVEGDTLYYFVQEVPGCGRSNVDSVMVSVVSAPTTAQIVSSDPDNAICYGDQVIFTASPGGAAAYQFFVNGTLDQDGANNIYITTDLVNQDSVNVRVLSAAGCSTDASGIITAVTQMVIAWDSTNISACGVADGEIRITNITGATGPYTLNWIGPNGFVSNASTISNLERGLYTLTVVDNLTGCTEILDVNMREPVDFVISYTKTDVSTIGGTDGAIDLSIVGGSGNFSVSWIGPNGFTSSNEDISGLEAGGYIATVTDNVGGCTDAVSVQVNEPGGGGSLILTANKTDVTTCGAADGTINLIITGGSGDYFVSWVGPDGFTANTQNLSGLSGGLYIATVVDNVTGVTAQWTVLIDEPNGFVIEAQSNDITYCAGSDGSIQLTITGGSGNFSYLWSGLGGLIFTSTDKDISDLAVGDYRVRVTDLVSGCLDSTDVSVGKPAICDQPCTLNVQATTNNVTCPDSEDGAAVINIISGGSGDGNYYYSLDTGATWLPFHGDDITDIIDQGQGSYLYLVKDTVTSCMDTTVANVGISTNLVVAINVEDAGCALNDGKITFNVGGGGIPYEVNLIHADGFVDSQTGSGLFQFRDLSEGKFFYEVKEQSGCVITPVDSIELITDCSGGCTDLIATAHSFEDATCATTPNGKAVVDVIGGSSPYEYSVDGTTWITFISGNVIDQLPPNGSYNIVIRQDSINAGCNAEVGVIINGPPPIIQNDPIITVQTASCNVNDGAVKIGKISGGSVPYDYQVDGDYITLPNDSVVTDLRAGIHTFSIIDDVNCQADFAFVVSSPGSIIADAEEVPASCAAINLKSGIRVTVDLISTDVSGPYEAVIIPAGQPEDSTIYTLPDTGVRTIYGFDKGFYDVVVRSATGTGCSYFETIGLINGVWPVDFDIVAYDSIVGCSGDMGSITIGNVRGLTDSTFYVQLVRDDNLILDTWALYYAELENGFTIDENNTSNLIAGSYFIRMIQNQAGCSNITATSRAITIYEPNGVLDLEVLETEMSYPDQPTGSVLAQVLPSGGHPYEVLIQLIDPYVELSIAEVLAFNEARDWITAEAGGGDGTVYTVLFEELWPGNYEITVRDIYGCEVTIEQDVERDTRIFIPNVFTPNNDGYNDEFFIRNLPETGTEVVITNRLGKTVFKSKDYNDDNLWDGGEEADGIYYYRIVMSDGQAFSGWIELWHGSSP